MHWSGAGLRASWRPAFSDGYRGLVDSGLFRNDFDKDAVRENSAAEEVNTSIRE